jgi:hypothetical protein
MTGSQRWSIYDHHSRGVNKRNYMNGMLHSVLDENYYLALAGNMAIFIELQKICRKLRSSNSQNVEGIHPKALQN